MTKTLFIVKPNATRRNLIGAVIAMLEKGGLRVTALRRLGLTKQQACEFYAVHRERPFYDSLVGFMTSGPVVAGVLEGEDAVAACRRIMGATDPAKADPGTIRACFGENIQENAIHGSDSDDNARREIAFFFPEIM